MSRTGSGISAVEIGFDEQIFSVETVQAKKINGATHASRAISGLYEGDAGGCGRSIAEVEGLNESGRKQRASGDARCVFQKLSAIHDLSFRLTQNYMPPLAN